MQGAISFIKMDFAYDTGFEIALNFKYFQSAESVTKSEVKSQ